MKYIGPKEEASVALFRLEDVVWRLVDSSDTVVHIADEYRVQAWRLSKGGRTCVIKYSTRDRLWEAAAQTAAECQASIYLSDHGPHPLLVLPVKTIIDTKFGAFTIMPDAGTSAAVLLDTEWAELGGAESEELSRNFVICALLTQTFYGTTDVGSEQSGPRKKQPKFLHRDIKPQNPCWDAKYKFFRLIDHGLFSSVDRTYWVNGIDKRYIDCQMSYLDPETGVHSALSADGIYNMTFPSSDIFQTALAAYEVFSGHLPKQLCCGSYSSDADYCDEVWGFKWDKCSELAGVPPGMRDWLLWALSFNPDDRPQCAEEALDHPWLRDHVQGVQEAIAAAQSEWEDSLQALDQDIRHYSGGCSSKSSSGDDSSSRSSGTAATPETPTCSPLTSSFACCSSQPASSSSRNKRDDSTSCSIIAASTGTAISSLPSSTASGSSQLELQSSSYDSSSTIITASAETPTCSPPTCSAACCSQQLNSTSSGDFSSVSSSDVPTDTPVAGSSSSSTLVAEASSPTVDASTPDLDALTQPGVHLMVVVLQDPGQLQQHGP